MHEVPFYSILIDCLVSIQLQLHNFNLYKNKSIGERLLWKSEEWFKIKESFPAPSCGSNHWFTPWLQQVLAHIANMAPFSSMPSGLKRFHLHLPPWVKWEWNQLNHLISLFHSRSRWTRESDALHQHQQHLYFISELISVIQLQ